MHLPTSTALLLCCFSHSVRNILWRHRRCLYSCTGENHSRENALAPFSSAENQHLCKACACSLTIRVARQRSARDLAHSWGLWSRALQRRTEGGPFGEAEALKREVEKYNGTSITVNKGCGESADYDPVSGEESSLLPCSCFLWTNFAWWAMNFSRKVLSFPHWAFNGLTLNKDLFCRGFNCTLSLLGRWVHAKRLSICFRSVISGINRCVKNRLIMLLWD